MVMKVLVIVLFQQTLHNFLLALWKFSCIGSNNSYNIVRLLTFGTHGNATTPGPINLTGPTLTTT